MPRKVLRSSWFNCLLIGLVFLVVAHNFWEKKNRFIAADGRAYYEYLPATFIYGDLKFAYLDTLHSELYSFEESTHFYEKVNGSRINKYFIGTALCETPAFLLSHLVAKSSSKYRADGFSEPYQWGIYLNAFLFFLLGLFCISELLKSYDIPPYVRLLLLFGLAFCTSLPFYVYVDSSYSHVYSFAAVSFFLYALRRYLLTKGKSWLIFLLLAFALIVLIRPVNGLVLLFLPLLFSSKEAFFSTMRELFSARRKALIIGLLLAFALFALQLLSWYFSRGKWFVYSYGKEGFEWSHLHFADFLFSARKGFFFWSPWFFLLCCSGLIAALVLKRYRYAVSWLLAFYLLVFVSCSWWFWSYASSYGSRPMVDFYAAFVLLAIPFLQHFRKTAGVLLILGLFFAPLTITQVYQYQRFIIKGDDMSWQNYKDVFMQRGPIWEGYLLKQQVYDLPAFYSKKGPKSIAVPAHEIFCADSVQVNGIRFRNAVFAEFSFDSPQLPQDDWVNLCIFDTNRVLVKEQAFQLKDLRKFPTDSLHYRISLEVPDKLSCLQAKLFFHYWQQAARVKNIAFKLRQYE